MKRLSRFAFQLTFVSMVVMGCLLFGKGEKVTDPDLVDEDFAYQGEYAGKLGDGSDALKLGVQVVAMGESRFQAVAYLGGLPGDGWNKEPPVRGEGTRSNDSIRFEAEKGAAVVRDGGLTIFDENGNQLGELQKVFRESPTSGKAPPASATVLFDGSKESLKNWKGGRISDDGLLMEGTTSTGTFGDHQLHLEFRLAYQPEDRGQGRSNSGLYVQGRYEVQILDSFGLEGRDNECGGLYSVKAPDQNMCFGPLVWQTYDIDFRAARFDDQGKLTENPRITVRHNGVLVHDDVQLPGERSTTAAPVNPGSDPGPVFLQNHGCPLRYRNIWIVAKESA